MLLFIFLLAALLLLALIVLIIVIIIRRKNNQQAQGDAFTTTSLANQNPDYAQFNQMTDSQLNSYINQARTDYLAWAGVQTTPSLAPGALVAGNLPLRDRIEPSQTAKDVFTAIGADPGTWTFVLPRIAKFAGTRMQIYFDGRLVKLLAKEEAKFLAEGAGRLMARFGAKASAKALTAAAARISARLALMGQLAAAGPAGWVADAVIFTMQATFGMMDQFGVGGYEELVTERMYMGMRDYFDREWQQYCKDKNWPYPMIRGPLDNLGDEEFKKKIGAEIDQILTEDIPVTRLVIALLRSVYETTRGREPTDAELQSAIDNDSSGVSAGLFKLAYERLAAKNNARVVESNGNFYNSYMSREATEAAFNWPLKDEKTDVYMEWDDTNKVSFVCSSKMREYAEGLGFGCTYDKVRRLPKVTEQYCSENGLYFDGQGKQCNYKSSGQKVAELIFGKAFVRGLLQVFDPAMYKKCSDMDWCKDGKCTDDGSYFCTKSTLSYSRPPVQRKCPDGTSETTPGFCNKDCPDGFFRMPGDQICYDSRTRGKALSYPTRYKCSQAPFTYKLDPVETAATRCYNTWCKVKTGPHTRCTSKPAPCNNEAACWQSPVKSCDPGYTEVGGMCYRISRPLETAKPKTGVAGIGVCPSGTSRKSTDDLCYAPCKDGFDDWPAGVCNSKSSNPKLEVKPKERKAPYGKTDFKNSAIGQRIQNIKDNMKQGDVAGLAAGIGALYLQACPMVNGLGLQDFANMIPNT